MAVDWLADVKKYVSNPDEAAVAGIVRHCGIALRNRDSSLVSFTDKAETDRVRTNFLKKKLGRTESNDVLDQAIAAVGERMKGDHTKNRVTVYYLLAEHFGQLALFHGKAKADVAGASTGIGTPAADAALETGNGADNGAAGIASAGLAAGAGALGLAGAGGAAAEAAATPSPPPPPAAPPVSAATSSTGGSYSGAGTSGGSGSGAGGAQGFADVPQGGGGNRWWLWALLAVLVLLILFFLMRSCQPQPAATGSLNTIEANTSDVGTASTNDDMLANVGDSAGAIDGNAGTAAAVPPAAPAGAGVTETTSNGAPALNVYFDKGKSDVTADFSAAATKLTAYLSAHPGATLEVSGYNDPSGNAAVNAQISKERAQHVAAALKTAGVPDSAVALVKPSDTTITSADADAARRVEVTVKQ
jgi:outer membrane protein OmpA-like peptidoglycan-associated protein